jgi:hypothetical protein
MTDSGKTDKEELHPSATAAVRARTDTVEPDGEPASIEATVGEATRERGKELDAAVPPASDESAAPLFSSKESSRMRSRWEGIQAAFVDEPRNSLQMADEIVSEAINHLTEGFAVARKRLEPQGDQANGVSTEDLRLSLRRYKAFFERLLSI